jgi:hypothetical protein
MEKQVKKISIYSLACVLAFSSSVAMKCFAEDEDLDLDYYFSKRQKSTLDDFPLQEIGQEELSNAVIEGALQANSQASDKTGKPIYLEKKDESDKKKSKVAGDEDIELNEAEELFKFSQLQAAPIQFQQQTYQQPTGRTYIDHQTTTVERP